MCIKKKKGGGKEHWQKQYLILDGEYALWILFSISSAQFYFQGFPYGPQKSQYKVIPVLKKRQIRYFKNILMSLSSQSYLNFPHFIEILPKVLNLIKASSFI